MVQPLARDYVPRRSGEIAASLLQAYALFHHITYDAGGACFVPGNAALNAGYATPVIIEYYARKLKLLVLGSWPVVSRSAPAGCLFAGANAALNFRLQILAQIFRNDAGRGQFAQIRHREFGQVGENRRKRRCTMTHKREANIVSDRPLAMLNDGRDNGIGKFLAGQRPQDLRFGHVRIVENNGDNPRVALGQQRACHARRPATRQRNFLSERKLRKPREQLIFGTTLQLGGNAWQDGHLYEG